VVELASLMPAIELENVAKRFGATRSLDGLTLSVDAGTLFGFLGPNGAGKTTTLRILLGLVRPDQGKVSAAHVEKACTRVAVIAAGRLLAAGAPSELAGAKEHVDVEVAASIRFGPQLLPPLTLASVIAGSIAASLFTSSIAVILSSRMDVARSAQQAASMASMLLLFGAVTLIENAGPMTAGAFLRAEAVVIAVAVGLLTLAARAFRRDRLFG
jgi:hypothetical protein